LSACLPGTGPNPAPFHGPPDHPFRGIDPDRLL